MNKEISILINNGNFYKDDNLNIEITNLDSFLQMMNKSSNAVPAPRLEAPIMFKVTIDGKEYEGKTVFNSYSGLTSEIEKSCPYDIKVSNWELGRIITNPSIIFEIVKR